MYVYLFICYSNSGILILNGKRPQNLIRQGGGSSSSSSSIGN
jgi:hypothetical protein